MPTTGGATGDPVGPDPGTGAGPDADPRGDPRDEPGGDSPVEPAADPGVGPAGEVSAGAVGPAGEVSAGAVGPAGGPGSGAAGPGSDTAGQARELSRRRSTRRRYPDTGRRHHLGAAPSRMPVYGPDGAIVGTTRTSAHQLASLTVVQLDRLADTLRAEMAGAAAGLDFELAAGLRDELAAVTAALARR